MPPVLIRSASTRSKAGNGDAGAGLYAGVAAGPWPDVKSGHWRLPKAPAGRAEPAFRLAASGPSVAYRIEYDPEAVLDSRYHGREASWIVDRIAGTLRPEPAKLGLRNRKPIGPGAHCAGTAHRRRTIEDVGNC